MRAVKLVRRCSMGTFSTMASAERTLARRMTPMPRPISQSMRVPNCFRGTRPKYIISTTTKNRMAAVEKFSRNMKKQVMPVNKSMYLKAWRSAPFLV